MSSALYKYTAVAKALVFVVSWTAGLQSAVWAGPPFVTDDPEPVEFRHGEFYLASVYSHDKEGVSGTAPHFEANYGALHETQAHLIVPLAYNRSQEGSTQYGLGDIELGVKYRFLGETAARPQVGTFPLVEFPAGDSGRGLGEHRMRAFIPLWLQKSWGPWTTYGGGGYWYNPGPGNENHWFAGWVLQRRFSGKFTLGAELFHDARNAREGSDRTAFNAGAIVDFTERRHVLFSAGTDIHGENLLSLYGAYQLTF